MASDDVKDQAAPKVAGQYDTPHLALGPVEPAPAASAAPLQTPSPVGETPDSANPIDIAMVAERYDSSPDSPARILLEKQGRLIDADLRLRRWQILREHVAVGIASLSTLAGIAILALLAGLIWRAAHSDGVVVRPFSVPADVASTGASGEAVAIRFLDHINAMESRTRGVFTRRAGEFTGDSGEGIRLEIPQTGVSIGQLDSVLRGWLGSERLVTGELVRTASGFTLVVRLGRETTVRVEGTDLDELAARSAEQIYAHAEPVHTVNYLANSGRLGEALPILARLRMVGTPAERADGFSLSASQTADNAAAIAYGREAVKIAPAYAPAYWEIARSERGLGREAAALTASLTGLEVLKRPQGVAWQTGRRESLRHEMESDVATARGDFAAAQIATRQSYIASRPDAAGGGTGIVGLSIQTARLLTRTHDRAGAEEELNSAALTAAPGLTWRLAHAEIFAGSGESSAAVSAYRALLSELDAADIEARQAGWSQAKASKFIRLPIMAALTDALSAAGDIAEAEATIEATPLDCYPCLTARAWVAERRGDRTQADRRFGEAVPQGPSLPFAYAAWGEAKLARGDAEGAIALFRQAHATGPNWADPLELRGEALMKQGDWRGAVAKFAEADRLAPRWGRLHLRWGEALFRLGRRDEARRQLQTAASLELSAEDRARIPRIRS